MHIGLWSNWDWQDIYNGELISETSYPCIYVVSFSPFFLNNLRFEG